MKNKINSHSLKFSNLNETCTVSDVYLKRKKLLKFVGRYNFKLFCSMVERLKSKNVKHIDIYMFPHRFDDDLNVLVLENLNKKRHGVALAPRDVK